MSDRDAFLRWCHPDLLAEPLRHGCACWQVLRALKLDPAAYPAPVGGSVSVITTPGGELGISSMLMTRPGEASSRSRVFLLEPSPAPIWVLALLHQRDVMQPIDPLDARQWLFWVVPAHRFHPERRSIALQPLIRAHGGGLSAEALQTALGSSANP